MTTIQPSPAASVRTIPVRAVPVRAVPVRAVPARASARRSSGRFRGTWSGLWLAGLIAVCVQGPAEAEPPSTSYIFPAGGRRGSQVEVRIGGHYLHDRCRFELLGAGVSGPPEIARIETRWFEGPLVRLPASQRAEDYPQDFGARIDIAADAVPGVRYWRAWNAQGATAARKFVVGDLPETIEDEIDGEPIPATVQAPLTINGRIYPREDVDVWSFESPAGRRWTVEAAAQSLGSPLEARLEIRDPAGRPIADATAPTGQDPRLQFEAREAGVYQLRIQDARYEGLQNFVYRVTIDDAPQVDAVYPAGGRRGQTVVLRPVGAGLPDGPVSAAIPTANGDSADPGFWTTRLEIGGRPSSPVRLAVSDLPEALEQEPNDSPEQANKLEAPAVANGRVDRPGDRDVWSFESAAGAVWTIDAAAARLGSPVDARLVLLDDQGKELARADDGPNNSPDARLQFTASKAGRYAVQVSDRFAGRGGAKFVYRLTIAAARPSVRLELAADVLAVDRAGQQKLAVNAIREGGFAGPVTLAVEGLPPGVTAPDVTIAANQNKGELVFKAEPTAPVDAARLRIVGRYELDGASTTTTIGAPSRPGEPPLDSVLLAVTLPTPFKFQGSYELAYIPCGAVSRKRYSVERNGYTGPLVVQLADRQNRHLQGVTGPVLTVPAGVDEFVYPITLPPWMELGRTSRVVLMATGEVDDGTGRKHKVSFTSGDQNNQMVNLVSPSPLRVTLDRASLAVTSGGEATVGVTLRRDPAIQSAARVELVLPSHLRGVQAEPIEIPAGATQGRLTLRFATDAGPFNMPAIVRAAAKRGDDPLIAEAALELVPRP